MKFNWLFFFVLLVGNSFAQKEFDKDSIWEKGGMITINFSQSALSNWSSGGQSSLSELNQVNLYFNYSKGDKSWENTLDMAYGIQRKSLDKAFKTDDKIDFASKYGYHAFDHIDYTGLFSFKTQFASGYNQSISNKISDFFAPAYLGTSVGLDYKPSDDFTFLLAPFSNKTTIVTIQSLADQGAFGVKKAEINNEGKIISPGQKIRSQFGGYIKILYKKDIMENVSVQTKLDLFSDYLKNPQNIDVYWDVLLNFKINKFLSANLTSTLIYDDDVKIISIDKQGDKKLVGPRIQFKEVLAIGVSYKL